MLLRKSLEAMIKLASTTRSLDGLTGLIEKGNGNKDHENTLQEGEGYQNS